METQTPKTAKLERSLYCPTAPVPILEMGKWRSRVGWHLTLVLPGTSPTEAPHLLYQNSYGWH